MRVMTLTLATAVLVLSSGLAQASEARETREQKKIDRLTERASRSLEAADRERSRAATLRHLSRAIQHLERARRIDETAGRSDLVRALNAKTRIHLDRRALPRAERYNRRALEVDRQDASALNLQRGIAFARGVDLDDQFRGSTAAQRLAERRAAEGPTYRPRGILRRR